MQILSWGDSLHVMPKPLSWKNKENISVLSSEIFTQHAKH